jgi:hypothetical protein
MSDDILVEFVTGPESAEDPAELEQLALALRAELLELDDVSAVEQATAGPAPDGTKGLDVAAIGSLVVSVVPGVQAAAKVIEVVQRWLARRAASTPPLKMTVGGNCIELVPDKEQQDALVRQFIEALRAGPAPATGS